MTHDIAIEPWHLGSHWSVKKSDDQYRHKTKERLSEIVAARHESPGRGTDFSHWVGKCRGRVTCY